jgi:catechol 2,3-dioxygenase-like lactoylglutathione lyase family enzyme
MTFDHIGLVVEDLAQGRHFLETTLAIAAWTPITHDEHLGVSVQFGRSGTTPTIELIAPLGPSSPVVAALRGSKSILNHLAYRVENLTQAAEDLRKNGCIATGEPKPALAYRGAPVQFFVSPLRFLIELIEAPEHVHPFPSEAHAFISLISFPNDPSGDLPLTALSTPRCGACTIVSPNYLAYARTLAASYLAHHPGHRFFVLIVADHTDPAVFATEADGFTPISFHHIGLEDVRGTAMMYDILELNTNVKPTFLKHLFATYDLDNLIYLDPDIFVYAPLTPVFEALQAFDAVLTPHITTPVFDGKSPSEQDHLYNGTYNLGFFAVRRGQQGSALLSWWERRCLDVGFSEGRAGLFVDQKWMNLAPGLFENIATLRHLGCNMAYWNLHERILSSGPAGYVVNHAEPLCFFHFSGVVLDDPAVLSRNNDRYQLCDRPDLTQLFAHYKAAVLANRRPEVESIPYGFGTLSDGTVVTRLARRIYAQHRRRFAGQDPFAAQGAFAAFARKLKLVAGKEPPQKSTWKEFNPKDRRVELIHKALKQTLRLIGPNRYELLMRYLAYIAILRNQSVFLDDGKP